MLETAECSNDATYFRDSTPRTLTWIRETHFYGPGCSRCAWLFRSAGSSLKKKKENYMRDCLEEFAVHDCAEHPMTAKTSAPVNPSSRQRSGEGRSAARKLRSSTSDSQSSRSKAFRVSKRIKNVASWH